MYSTMDRKSKIYRINLALPMKLSIPILIFSKKASWKAMFSSRIVFILRMIKTMFPRTKTPLNNQVFKKLLIILNEAQLQIIPFTY